MQKYLKNTCVDIRHVFINVCFEQCMKYVIDKKKPSYHNKNYLNPNYFNLTFIIYFLTVYYKTCNFFLIHNSKVV